MSGTHRIFGVGAVALLGEGALVLPLQGHPARVAGAQCVHDGRVPEVREAAAHPAGGDARRARPPGLDADPRGDRGALPGAVASIRRTPVLAFLSALIEEFGDEWGNKWMFHYRWARPADQDSAGERIARSMRPDAAGAELAQITAGVKERMVGRVGFVGSSPEHRAADRGQLSRRARRSSRRTCERVPTCSARGPRSATSASGASSTSAGPTRRRAGCCARSAPRVLAWVERMLEPKAEGDFEAWRRARADAAPLLERQIGALFLPWSDANAQAIAAGAEEMVAWHAARAVEAEAAEVPRAFARRAPQEVRRRRRQGAARPDPRARGLPALARGRGVIDLHYWPTPERLEDLDRARGDGACPTA